MANGIQNALDGALAGCSGFTLYEGQTEVPPGDLPDFSAHSGQLVFWSLQNSASSLWTFFKAMADGVVPVVLASAMAPGRLDDLIDRHAGFGVFDGSTVKPSADPVRAREDMGLVLMTSGSTGEARLVAGDHDGLIASIAAIHSSQGLESITSTGLILPAAYSYALINQVLWALLHQRRLFLVNTPLAFAETLDGLRSMAVEMMCMVGSQARTMTNLGLGGEQKVPSVKVLNFAGAPFPTAEFDGLVQMFPGAALYNNYGCTEALPRLTCCRVKSREHPVTDVGKPIGDIELSIAGDEDVGPILFKGSSVSTGILEPDGAVQKHGDWIASGDMGRLEGGRLHVYGRHDQVIKVDGERISLVEIENALLSMGYERAMAWKLNDPYGPENVAAVVKGGGSSGGLFESVFQNLLPLKAWPETVYAAMNWLVTANGKTDRARLSAMAEEGRMPTVWSRRSRF
jgi:long-chain acyl-CoA synthetase